MGLHDRLLILRIMSTKSIEPLIPAKVESLENKLEIGDINLDVVSPSLELFFKFGCGDVRDQHILICEYRIRLWSAHNAREETNSMGTLQRTNHASECQSPLLIPTLHEAPQMRNGGFFRIFPHHPIFFNGLHKLLHFFLIIQQEEVGFICIEFASRFASGNTMVP